MTGPAYTLDAGLLVSPWSPASFSPLTNHRGPFGGRDSAFGAIKIGSAFWDAEIERGSNHLYSLGLLANSRAYRKYEVVFLRRLGKLASSLLVFSSFPSGRTAGLKDHQLRRAKRRTLTRRVGPAGESRTREAVGNAPVNRDCLRQSPVGPAFLSTRHRRPRPARSFLASAPLAPFRPLPAYPHRAPAPGRHGSSPWQGRAAR